MDRAKDLNIQIQNEQSKQTEEMDDIEKE